MTRKKPKKIIPVSNGKCKLPTGQDKCPPPPPNTLRFTEHAKKTWETDGNLLIQQAETRAAAAIARSTKRKHKSLNRNGSVAEEPHPRGGAKQRSAPETRRHDRRRRAIEPTRSAGLQTHGNYHDFLQRTWRKAADSSSLSGPTPLERMWRGRIDNAVQSNRIISRVPRYLPCLPFYYLKNNYHHFLNP